MPTNFFHVHIPINYRADQHLPLWLSFLLTELDASARSSAAEIRTLSSSLPVAIFALSKTNTTSTVAEQYQLSSVGDVQRI